MFNYFIFILQRGKRREKERERNIDVREKHWLGCLLQVPQLGTNPQPWRVLWLGIKTVWSSGLQDDTQPSCTGHSWRFIFKILLYLLSFHFYYYKNSFWLIFFLRVSSLSAFFLKYIYWLYYYSCPISPRTPLHPAHRPPSHIPPL